MAEPTKEEIQEEIKRVRKRLADGNERFVNSKLEGKLQDGERRSQLLDGQEPWAIVLSCADSRVSPELTFDTGLGELFVIRVAGNIANTSSIASIEYAVAHLKTRVIVVLGHESCGAVDAAIGRGDNGYNLNHLLAHITPALVASGKDAPATEVVKKNAQLNAMELADRSSIIGDALRADELVILPAYYNLKSGKVDIL